MKKRILVATDASFLSSGYGIYAKEILSRFNTSSDYEVAELACYATTNSKDIQNIPWKVYPNAVEVTDSRYADYASRPNNQFGAWRFNKVCAHFKPHIVLTWTDYWMYAYQELSPYRKYFHWIQMPMVDSAPQKLDWLYTFSNADIVIPYTRWAYKVLSESCGNKINLHPKIANAGINKNEFFPIDNKSEHKKSILGFDGDIIGCVMRNQKRKLFVDTMESFRSYLDKLTAESKLEKYKKTFLYLHTTYPEESGWDFPSLLLEYKILDKVFFSYVCRHCKHYFPSKFNNAVARCPKCNNFTASLPSVANGVDTNTLNKIYNTFDLFIQNAIAEGFGMPQLEAAACGVPFASVDYSAMSEIAENLHGFKIPVQRTFRELESNANRVYPDNIFVSNLIYDFFNGFSADYIKDLSKRVSNACHSIYTWDNVYSVWKECCDLINIENKISWKNTNTFQTQHGDIKVPKGLNPKDFVTFICVNVLKEPDIIYTSYMQNLIKDLSSQLVARNGTISHFDHKKVIEILEAQLNNKIVCGEILNHHNNLLQEDFLACHK